MDEALKKEILKDFEEQKGNVGLYYKNLVTGDMLTYNADKPFLAASVIKLPIFMCVSKWCEEGKASMKEKILVRDEDKLPSCGALNSFTDEIEVNIRTLCNLMITISDNSATNLLIKRFGMENYAKEFENLGLKNTKLNRLLFDAEASEKGIENFVVPSEIGMLLEKLYKKEFVNEQVSETIINTMLKQQIKHKIRGGFTEKVDVAHKTGEDTNLSNDVGIVFAKQPFIVCFTGYDVVVPKFEQLIRNTAAKLYEINK